MPEKLDHLLECPDCRTIYLDIPPNVKGDTPIHCSVRGKTLGTWAELERDFDKQGGQHGVFELKEGQIIRIQ